LERKDDFTASVPTYAQVKRKKHGISKKKRLSQRQRLERRLVVIIQGIEISFMIIIINYFARELPFL